MKPAKYQAKPLMVAQFQAEARRLAGTVSENQIRFLKARKAKGKDMEPVGRLAGAHA
ncbi:hypothetical protein D3C78_1932930 [compost metagenome]